MACPTCSHTMHGLGHDIFWCPRCGTLRTGPDATTPYLVERARRFERECVQLQPADRRLWHSLGIGDSIGPVA
jgi:tRNA(Ile2) C34 agmatinyltransferase TiaS